MEQLAQFVTKSFEFNNNRVMDLLNMATRVDHEELESNTKGGKNASKAFNEPHHGVDSDSDGGESEEIDITDESLPRPSPKPVPHELHDSSNERQDTNGQSSPLSLVKKSTRGVTKNWLISDDEVKQPTDENQRPQKGFFDALNLSRVADYSVQPLDVQFRPKPVTELLKEIRKFQSSTPPPLSTRLDDNYGSRSSSPEQMNTEGNRTCRNDNFEFQTLSLQANIRSGF